MLSVRARQVLAGIEPLLEHTSEAVAAWIREHVPPGHNDLRRMHNLLRRHRNCGEETAQEIIAFAFGEERLKQKRVRLTCSVCGETANLLARGETCDQFQRWWVDAHRQHVAAD